MSLPSHAANEIATTKTTRRGSLTSRPYQSTGEPCVRELAGYARRVITRWLDRVLYRAPFEGASARRYVASARPAFGDLDDRLLDGMAPMLATARYLLDLGAGPATFAACAAARHPTLSVLAIEPSRELSRARAGVTMLRAIGEALPVATSSIDVAMCLSSIRHVRDRAATLRELRRVVRGSLVIVELDPSADAARIATHAERINLPLLRRAFGPLVVRTAPTADSIAALAVTAGWRVRARRDDPVQPVYVLELR
jgi:SAM-dependent methyltransferase